MTLNFKILFFCPIKNTKFLVLFLAVFGTSLCLAQNQMIRLPQYRTTIQEIFQQIEKQTQLSVDYNYSQISDILKKEVTVKNGSVRNMLNETLKGTGLTYRFENNHIVVYPKYQDVSSVPVRKKTINGIIVGKDREPIGGCAIREKGTENGSISDMDGKFSLNISENATLSFSCIGYKTYEIKVTGQTRLYVILQEETLNLDEVVIVGYGIQKKVNLTGSIASVNADEIRNIPSSSLSNSLSGKLSGVLITSLGGKPGVGSSMQIRSVGTWNNNAPLYVIDGVVRDKFAFDGLDASEIENLSVLKDGASAAIYGARAANGVILVTTKKGKFGKPVISYTGTVGLSDATRLPQMMNAYEQATIINDALAIHGYDASSMDWFTDDELEYFKHHSYNWLQEAWKQPVLTRHSINVSGGSEHVRYFIGGTYYDETGSFDNLRFKKYNLRSNIEANITKHLMVSLNMNMDIRNDRKPYWRWDGDSDNMENLYRGLLFRTGMVPPYIDGKPVREIGGNTFVEWSPMELIDGTRTGYNRKKYSTYDTSLSLQYNVPFIQGLSAKLLYNKIMKHSFVKMFCFPYLMYNFKGTGTHNHIPTNELVGTYERSDGNYLEEYYVRRDNYQLNMSLSYVKKLGKHDIGALVVYEQSEGYYDDLWVRGYDYASMNIDQLNMASKKNPRIDGEGSETARISYVGRINYAYDSKYLFEGAFRYDASVNFAPKHRWGFFPSASLAWRISEEPFFKKSVPFIDFLKIRTSVGLLGNDAVGGWQWMQRYNLPSRAGAIFGTTALTGGLEADVIPNEKITWEKTLTNNIGWDSRWFNKLTFNFDFFFKHTYDILGNRLASLPTTVGVKMPAENYAVIDGKGFELELGWNDKISDVDYYIKGNLSYAVNKLKKKDEAENIRAYQSSIGYNYDRKMGYIATDIIRTQKDLDALPKGYTIFGRKPELGMLNYRDLRGPDSDEPDGIIDENDKDWIVKHIIPPFNFGLLFGAKWKGWALDIFLQGVAGNDKVIDMRDPQTRISESTFKYWNDRWTPEHTDAKFPRAAENQCGYYSTFWKRDGSFVRLKNINLSYQLPSSFLSKLGIDYVQFFITGSNLCLLYDKVKYFDPESTSIVNYPLMKSFSVGVNVNF